MSIHRYIIHTGITSREQAERLAGYVRANHAKTWRDVKVATTGKDGKDYLVTGISIESEEQAGDEQPAGTLDR